MFDVSFGELMLIGVIALVVIGPQRLPKVARTLGHLLGRAQRYVNDVKSDIQREIDLEELNKVKHQMENAAQSVQSSMQGIGDDLSKPVQQARQAVNDATRALQASVQAPAPANPTTTPGTQPATPTDALPPAGTSSLPAPDTPKPAST